MSESVNTEPITYARACSVSPENRDQISEAVERMANGLRLTMLEMLREQPPEFRGRFECRLTLIQDD